MKLDKSYQRTILNIVKLILLFGTFGFLFYKLFYAYDVQDLYHNFSFDTSWKGFALLSSVIVLSVVNLLLESSKWHLLINKSEQMGFMQAFKSVLSGVALSIITPNQIGNFVGRVIHLKRFNKIKGSLVAVIGHTAQVIMTMAFGFYAFIWFLHDQHKISYTLSTTLNITLFALVVLTLFGFLHIKWIGKITQHKKIKPYLQVFTYYSRGELVQVLMISFLRYIVFLVQYNLLLHFYQVDTTLEQSIACIISTLFAQSFVPSFVLLDIGIRGASALWFFSFYTQQTTNILLSVYTLWIINLMLPGLLGLYFILKWRMNK